MDRDKEKDRLAMIMTYGPEAGEALATHYVQLSPKVANEREAESNEFEDRKQKPPGSIPPCKTLWRFGTVIDEIGEREEFLQRMEKVGLSKEHRERIEQEVVEVRSMYILPT